ncbi:MAG: IS701 family transposase, partial [Chlorogloea purpurea SAG 13.99]|nr:IS701 family transposase [Chlorogloea purpurea SAG 13.99]
QKTLLGVYRFLVLSMIAYILAHWAALWSNRSSKPDWGQAALLAAENLFPLPVLSALIIKIRRLRGLARQNGLELVIQGWQYG